MKRKIFCFCVLLVSCLFGCSREVNDEEGNHIVVVGTAINMIGSAAVESGESDYYLDDVAQWDAHLLGKKVRVEGKLFVKIYPAPPCPEPVVDPNAPPPPPPTSRMVGDFELIIKNPKIVTL